MLQKKRGNPSLLAYKNEGGERGRICKFLLGDEEIRRGDQWGIGVWR